MRVYYIGNFEPPHSTENEVLKALRHLGHEVTPWQENRRDAWEMTPTHVDFVLWTRTGWHARSFGWSDEQYRDRQRALLARCDAYTIPVVGYHLDRWWGLPRESQIGVEPFFEVDLLVTADGGHAATWEAVTITHVWMPPAISEFECVPGRVSERFTSDLAFVGSWTTYHPEWQHRFSLVKHLQQRADVTFWPAPGQHAVRGDDLRDLYASTKINIGDSCLVGGVTHYCSDRIPETLGRGGFLLHPHVHGITDDAEHAWQDGDHLVGWVLDTWDDLDFKIEHYLRHPHEARDIAETGRAHTMQHHTYTERMRSLVELVETSFK